MSIFRQVIPSSFWDIGNKEFQYYLVWLSNEGGVRSWLFAHTKGDQEERFDNVPVEGLSDIRSIPVEQRTEVDAMTKGLDSDTFDYVKSLMASNRVYQIGTDQTLTPVGIREGKVVRDNELKSFGVQVKFFYKRENILNV